MVKNINLSNVKKICFLIALTSLFLFVFSTGSEALTRVGYCYPPISCSMTSSEGAKTCTATCTFTISTSGTYQHYMSTTGSFSWPYGGSVEMTTKAGTSSITKSCFSSGFNVACSGTNTANVVLSAGSYQATGQLWKGKGGSPNPSGTVSSTVFVYKYECLFPPANSYVCSGADSGLTADITSSTLVSSCTGAKCQYLCNTGYYKSGTVCQKCPCTSGDCCDGCNYRTSSYQCRSSAGVCDKADYCSGSSATCPSTYLPSSTLCRSATDVCDTAAYCTGGSTTCPGNAYKSSSTQCRAAADVCDKAETCSGSSPSCPGDTYQSGTQCRSSAGVCDQTEYCSGFSTSCPGDTYQPSSTLCRSSAGVCDIAEYCQGGSSCPTNIFQPAGTICGTNMICDGNGNCIQGFDFNLSNTGNNIINRSSSVTNTINSTLISGTASSVVYSAAGLPSGATYSFSPASCTPKCAPLLTIAASSSTSPGEYTIIVTGIGGGLTRTTQFQLNVTENGACGTRNATYISTTTDWPGGSTYCSSGTNDPAPLFPSPGTSVTWTCQGKYGGNSVSCTATTRAPSADGICGPAAKEYNSSEIFPSGAYCSSTAQPSTTPSNPLVGGLTQWICPEEYGGNPASCNATRNNTCGSTKPSGTAGTITIGLNEYSYGYATTSWTYDNLATSSTPCKWKCNSGYMRSSSTCIETVPSVCQNFNVSCETNIGDINSVRAFINYSGSEIECPYIENSWDGNFSKFACNAASIPLDTIINVVCAINQSRSYQQGPNQSLTVSITSCGSANGTCGATQPSCLSGRSVDFPDNSTHYLWRCAGLYGGSNASCSLIIPINGLCSTTTRNNCINGTWAYIPNNSTHYLWKCNGINGGSNATCILPIVITVVGACNNGSLDAGEQCEPNYFQCPSSSVCNNMTHINMTQGTCDLGCQCTNTTTINYCGEGYICDSLSPYLNKCIPTTPKSCFTDDVCDKTSQCCYGQTQYNNGTCISSLPLGISSDLVNQNSCLCRLSRVPSQPMNGSCLSTGDYPCWYAGSGQYLDRCCGNNVSETWTNIFSTSSQVEDVLPTGYCENGKWKSREDSSITYYTMVAGK